VIWTTAILAGFLFGLATWLILHRNWLRIAFGVMLLGHGANLVILSSSGNPDGRHPPITEGGVAMVDPLPQALLLTAIVIGFAVVAYFLTLIYRLKSCSSSSNVDSLFDPETK
jgi:multicomponent Na+:H+ antiporter subunit C